MTNRYPIIQNQKPADEKWLRGSTPLALLTLLLSMPVQAESDFCAGKRLGFVMTYCNPNNRTCLNQRFPCHGQGSFQKGFAEGKWLAQNRVRLELKLVEKIIRENQQKKESGK